MERDYMPDDLEGEAPCEFCGELYPLILLIEHQSTHMTGDDDYSYLDEILNQQEVQNVIETISIPSESKPNVEQNQQSAVKDEINTNEESAHSIQNPDSKTKSSEESAETDQKLNSSQVSSNAKSSEESAEKDQKQSSSQWKNTKKFTEQKGKEFITEKGEKLLVFGDEIDPDKELENEKSSYKMPNNPLLNSECKNEVEDINNLSDDDCNESLEEFWKRARDFLKRNRVKNES